MFCFETGFLCVALTIPELCRPGRPQTQRSTCLFKCWDQWHAPPCLAPHLFLPHCTCFKRALCRSLLNVFLPHLICGCVEAECCPAAETARNHGFTMGVWRGSFPLGPLNGNNGDGKVEDLRTGGLLYWACGCPGAGVRGSQVRQKKAGTACLC